MHFFLSTRWRTLSAMPRGEVVHGEGGTHSVQGRGPPCLLKQAAKEEPWAQPPEELWDPGGVWAALSPWSCLRFHLALLGGILALHLHLTLGKEAPRGGETYPRSPSWMMAAEPVGEACPWLPAGVFPLRVSRGTLTPLTPTQPEGR